MCIVWNWVGKLCFEDPSHVGSKAVSTSAEVAHNAVNSGCLAMPTSVVKLGEFVSFRNKIGVT